MVRFAAQAVAFAEWLSMMPPLGLPATSTTELKDQWRSLFGAEPPPYSQKFLESRLAYRIQELAYSGLSGRLSQGTRLSISSCGF